MRVIHYLRSRETQVAGGYSNGTRLLSPWPDRLEGLQLISRTLFRLRDLESILQGSSVSLIPNTSTSSSSSSSSTYLGRIQNALDVFHQRILLFLQLRVGLNSVLKQ